MPLFFTALIVANVISTSPAEPFEQRFSYSAPKTCESKTSFVGRIENAVSASNLVSHVCKIDIEQKRAVRATVVLSNQKSILLKRTFEAPSCDEVSDAVILALQVYFESRPKTVAQEQTTTVVEATKQPNLSQTEAPNESQSVERAQVTFKSPQTSSRLGAGIGIQTALTQTVAPTVHVDFEVLPKKANWLRWHAQLRLGYSIGESNLQSTKIVSQLAAGALQTCPIWPTFRNDTLGLRACLGVEIGAFLANRTDGDTTLKALPWLTPFLEAGFEGVLSKRWVLWAHLNVGYVALRPRITDETGLLFSVFPVSFRVEAGFSYVLF